jgi:uncharacterized protein
LSEPGTIDIWMQHPTPRFLREPMFDSLLRWMGVSELPAEIPIEFTLAAMDDANVSIGVLSAWHGP